jgi:hypothetical protein
MFLVGGHLVAEETCFTPVQNNYYVYFQSGEGVFAGECKFVLET